MCKSTKVLFVMLAIFLLPLNLKADDIGEWTMNAERQFLERDYQQKLRDEADRAQSIRDSERDVHIGLQQKEELSRYGTGGAYIPTRPSNSNAKFVTEKDTLLQEYSKLENQYLELKKIKDELQPKYDVGYDNKITTCKANINTLFKNGYGQYSPQVKTAISDLDMALKDRDVQKRNAFAASYKNDKYKETVKNMKAVENKMALLKKKIGKK